MGGSSVAAQVVGYASLASFGKVLCEGAGRRRVSAHPAAIAYLQPSCLPPLIKNKCLINMRLSAANRTENFCAHSLDSIIPSCFTT